MMRPLRKFRVQWTELHEVEVEARSMEEATTKAYESDYEITHKNKTLLGVEENEIPEDEPESEVA